MSTLVVILCHLPEKGRKEIEGIVEGRKRNRNESEETEETRAVREADYSHTAALSEEKYI